MVIYVMNIFYFSIFCVIKITNKFSFETVTLTFIEELIMALISALLPLIRPLQITSLSPISVNGLKYFTSKRFTIWSISSLFFLILLFIHGIIDSGFYSVSQASIGNTLIFIKLCSVRVGHITILIESFVQRKDLIEMINILSLIDSTLIKKLGIHVDHKGLKKLILKYLIIGTVIFLVIECSVLGIFSNNNCSKFLSFWITRLFSFAVICLRYLQIIIFIYMIRSRLSLININLNKIDTDSHEKFISIIGHVGHLEEDNRDMLKMQNKKFKNFDEIPILRELYGKLWDVSKLINTCFGTSLLVCVGNDFGTVTLNGYWMYLSHKKSKNLAIICSIGLWSVPHVICLVLIAGFCYSTVSKVSCLTIHINVLV